MNLERSVLLMNQNRFHFITDIVWIVGIALIVFAYLSALR